MDTVAVVVDVTDAADPALSKAMIDACSASVAQGICVLKSPLDGSEGRASVAWQSDQLVASIDMHLVSGGHNTREIPFRAEDPLVERWKSVGLVIATLVSDARRARETPATPPTTPPTPAAPTMDVSPKGDSHPKTVRRPSLDRPHERFTTDLAFTLGNGFTKGAPRIGADLRAATLIPATPLFPVLEFGFAILPPDTSGVSARWVTIGAGLGVRAGLLDRTIALEARVEGVADWLGASVTEVSGVSDAGGRWQPGARTGIGLGWMFTRWLGLVGSVDGTFVRSGTVVRVQGAAIDRSAPEHIDGALGIRAGWL